MTNAKPKYYNVNKVTKTKAGKDIWRKVGVLFPNKETDGFQLIITEDISITGTLAVTLPKAGEEQEAA